MADDLTQTIVDNATGPAKVSGDSGSFDQHNLKDQIEVEKFRRESSAAGRSSLPFRILKIRPPGSA